MRYVLERHTNDAVWCWRVRDVRTGATYGYGLTEADADRLSAQLEAHDDD